jgi:hypothetical protein
MSDGADHLEPDPSAADFSNFAALELTALPSIVRGGIQHAVNSSASSVVISKYR